MQTQTQLGLRFPGMAALMSLIYSSFTSKAHFDGAGRSRGRASTKFKESAKQAAERRSKPINYRRAAAACASHVSDRCPNAGMPYTTIAQHDEYKRSQMPGTREHQALEFGYAKVTAVLGSNRRVIGHVLAWQ